MPTLITVQIAIDDIDPRPAPGEILGWLAQVSTEVSTQLVRSAAEAQKRNERTPLTRAGNVVGDALVMVNPPLRRRKVSSNEATDAASRFVHPQV